MLLEDGTGEVSKSLSLLPSERKGAPMDRHCSAKQRAHETATVLSAALLALAIAALVMSGCSSMGASGSQAPTASGSGSMSAKQASTASSKMSGMSTGSKDATGMVCAECSGGAGKVAPVKGEATVEGGVQVVRISLKDGRYTPTAFTLQASMPVKVMFDGTASDCLGHPMFQSLGRKADLSKGPASLDLGTLKPGTYKFSCAMGRNTGTISVQ